jgi:hypothetical protein
MSRAFVVAACGCVTLSASAQPCGQYWSDQFSFQGLDGAVRAVVIFDPDGDGPEPPAVYAGGEFLSYSGEVWLNHIARWTGTGWAPVGAGFDGTVRALAVFDDDGSGPNPSALYAGGTFTHADGAPAGGIAKWDGNTWSPLGSGVSGAVYALAEFDDDGPGPNLPALYAGGSFATAGDVMASNIARWDGTAWSGLGAGTNNAVIALAVYDADGDGPQPAVLVAGGGFTQADGLPANRVAQWSGSNWSSLGSGVSSYVYALTVFDADGAGPGLPVLVAGGSFEWAGGVYLDYVASWNGAAWAALGSGTNDIIRALASYDPDGDGPLNPVLIAGGFFTTAGGTNASRVAKWNGASWSALASGAEDVVYSLAVFDSDGAGPEPPVLLAAGNYTAIGGLLADHVASWDNAAWQPLVPYSTTGPNNMVLSLEAIPKLV